MVAWRKREPLLASIADVAIGFGLTVAATVSVVLAVLNGSPNAPGCHISDALLIGIRCNQVWFSEVFEVVLSLLLYLPFIYLLVALPYLLVALPTLLILWVVRRIDRRNENRQSSTYNR